MISVLLVFALVIVVGCSQPTSPSSTTPAEPTSPTSPTTPVTPTPPVVTVNPLIGTWLWMYSYVSGSYATLAFDGQGNLTSTFQVFVSTDAGYVLQSSHGTYTYTDTTLTLLYNGAQPQTYTYNISVKSGVTYLDLPGVGWYSKQ